MIRLNRFVTGEGNFEALQGTSAVIHCCADNIAEPVRLKLFHKQMALENDTRTVVRTGMECWDTLIIITVILFKSIEKVAFPEYYNVKLTQLFAAGILESISGSTSTVEIII